ncbi:hypothetical protein GM418_05855 [Maribellus comscasis]|uniref:Uncharacterized protein n=1 Tax=Maribellus comscasis TaxID=2681766 RepID=A0A6I6JQA1_9BACT|nr:hypothetical protein [Maribellus comscasis]QGY43200.1 hypothetical protein GM418_05855 [Maribellus comscasis]
MRQEPLPGQFWCSPVKLTAPRAIFIVLPEYQALPGILFSLLLRNEHIIWNNGNPAHQKSSKSFVMNGFWLDLYILWYSIVVKKAGAANTPTQTRDRCNLKNYQHFEY